VLAASRALNDAGCVARRRVSSVFPREEFEQRLQALRERLDARGLRGCLVTAPENVFYLTGLDHQGYFAVELLLVPREGEPLLITRAMEKATVRDQVPWIRHVGYSDGIQPLPEPEDEERDLVLSAQDGGESRGLRPWEMSVGVAVQGPVSDAADLAIAATREALCEAGLDRGRVGLEMRSAFLPYSIANGILTALPDVEWQDASGLVDDIRLIQSPLELEYTRRAAAVSDSMMLAAIAAAGPGVHEHDVMAAVYDAMFRRGGTYPGFVPLVRSTRTLEHEHGTWTDGKLRRGDLLFLEMAGCVHHYHAPLGRLVFVGQAPSRAGTMQELCERAMRRAAQTIGPGVKAGEAYRAWQDTISAAGLGRYRRHHCGYAVGIGFPPSWSGTGTPRGLRSGSDLVLAEGMVFHLMSWLLRTGRGDYFLSDTIIVSGSGAEFLTQTSRGLTIR
jgi:Xaa-Pro dipeptidase